MGVLSTRILKLNQLNQFMYKGSTSTKVLGWLQEQQAACGKKQETTNVGPAALYIRSRSLTRSIGSDIAIIFYASLDGRFRFIQIKSNFGRRKLHKMNKDFNFRNRGNIRPPIQFRRERES